MSEATEHVTNHAEDEAEYGRQGERPFQTLDWRLVKECGNHQEGSDYDKRGACNLQDLTPALASVREVGPQSQVYQSGEKNVDVA